MTKEELLLLLPKNHKGKPKNPRLRHLQKVLLWEKLSDQDLFFIQKEIEHYSTGFSKVVSIEPEQINSKTSG